MFLSPRSFSKGFKGRALKITQQLMNERRPPLVKDQQTTQGALRNDRRI